ncbi:unnamed protein product [Schistosoma intercalatum]|nr:unnamed protein product [Schistosoma intercalatum]CAH8524545.1 unnamed protein product [Schistosoma intercalatum]
MIKLKPYTDHDILFNNSNNNNNSDDDDDDDDDDDEDNDLRVISGVNFSELNLFVTIKLKLDSCSLMLIYS